MRLLQTTRGTIKGVLRAMGILSPARALAGRLGLASTHGHDLLVREMKRDARRGPLAGKWLVEVGTTRERLPGQGSTAVLGRFADQHRMRFTTVDMDPLNTAVAREETLAAMPLAEAVTAEGEQFLARVNEPVDYCYLDAFDIDHGQHSPQRRERYKLHLGKDISNEACYSMHLECAQALLSRMRPGGLVVFDDCWQDGGEWKGKGKSAVPLLVSHGFSVVARRRTAVALRRAEQGELPDRPDRTGSTTGGSS